MKRICVLILLLCGFSGSAFPDGKWSLYTTGYTSESFPEYISSLAMEGDTIWAGTAHGLVKWNRRNGTFQRYTTKDGLFADGISAIAIDHNGVKWLGQGETSRIASFNNTDFKTYSRENVPQIAEIDSLFNHNWGFSIDDIVVDPANTILFSSHGQYARADGGGVQYHSELFIYQNNTWKINTIPGNAGSPFHLAVDTAYPDTVWYGKNGPGIGYFVKPNYNEKTDNRFSSNDGGQIIAMDRNNFVWYGWYSDIYEFDRRTFTHFQSETTGIVNGISDIAVDKNNVKWFGSSMGITRYDGNTWKTYTPDGWHFTKDASTSDWVFSLAFDDDGVLWAGTNKGLYRFEETPVAVGETAPKPVSVVIEGISPNPFNASSTITFSLPNPGLATLTVYSLTGQKVRTLVSGRMSAGKHSAVWDGRDDRGGIVSSGVFIAMLQSREKTASRKMLLLK